MADLAKRFLAALVLISLIWAVYSFAGKPAEPRLVKFQIWQPGWDYAAPRSGEAA